METPSPPPITASAPAEPGSKWPKVIGIIAIIFGALAILQTAVAPFMIPFSQKSMEGSITGEVDQEKLDGYFADLASLSTMSSIVMGVVAILLLVGGILLLRKRRVAVPLLLTWAVLKAGLGCFFNYKNFLLMQTQFELLLPPSGGGQEEELVNSITTISATIGLVVGSLWILAFPIFLLVWFSRSKVRSQIQAW